MNLLLTGQSEHTIDDKLRLAVASKHRAQVAKSLGEDHRGWFCVPWPGGILRLYPSPIFRDLASQLDDTLMPVGDRAEMDAIFFSQAEELDADQQGRIKLPRKHLVRAGLLKENAKESSKDDAKDHVGIDVMVVGVRNRLEIYSIAAWNAREDERFSNLQALAERVAMQRRDGGGPHSPPPPPPPRGR